MERNDTPGGSRGQGTVVWADDRDPITTPQGKPQCDRARALLTELRGRYPVLGAFRPLSIGIRAAVQAAVPGVAHKLIDGALALHCHSDAYLQAIAAGGPRYVLDGTPSGEVSEEHRAAAVLVLVRRKEKAIKPPSPPRVLPVPLLHMAKTERRS